MRPDSGLLLDWSSVGWVVCKTQLEFNDIGRKSVGDRQAPFLVQTTDCGFKLTNNHRLL